VSEKITERAREKLMKAQRDLYNTARPGTPEYDKALAARNQALRDLLNSRKVTNNFIVKPPAQIRKYVDPRLKDINKGLERVGKGLNGAKGAPMKPNTSSGGPVKPTPGSKFLNGLGKLGKGLGIAGTALGLYNNVTKDGVAKGIVETATGTAAAYGAGIGITAACGAIGVATAGVGGLACAAVAFGGSYLAAKYGTKLGGWAYDRGSDAVAAVNQHVFKPVAQATTDAAKGVVEAGSNLVDGGRKVIGALNPFG
jgi:hypothetical protein